MRIISIILLLALIISCSANSENYNVYKNYTKPIHENEKIMFILDYSNSMREGFENSNKLIMMLSSLYKILPQINPKTQIGVRVYGQRMGVTPLDACRATKTLVPLGLHNENEIQTALNSIKPRGMTPITYSLKETIKKDFSDIEGPKRIILLTDGGENCDESPCKYAMKLVKTRRDVTIDVIAINVKNQDDIAQLQCSALVTSGKFYNVDTKAQMINSLSNSLDYKKEVNATIKPND